MKIKDICSSERPRERLLARGANTLSDGELLAVLLRCGTGGKSAVDVAQSLLSSCSGNLGSLFALSPAQLCAMDGIGPGKASAILAAAELGRRFFASNALEARTPVTSASQAYSLVIPYLKGLDHEEFWVILLNRSNYCIGREKITHGSQGTTAIDIPRVVRRCMETGAAACIMVHNHPSGSPRPSAADIKQTASAKAALEACDLLLLDHIIIGEGSFYSFNDEKLYKDRARRGANLSE